MAISDELHKRFTKFLIEWRRSIGSIGNYRINISEHKKHERHGTFRLFRVFRVRKKRKTDLSDVSDFVNHVLNATASDKLDTSVSIIKVNFLS